MAEPANIVVYGAGAIGGQIAVRLARAGLDPTVVEPWTPQREAIRAHGLVVRDEQSGAEERADLRVVAPGELGGPVGILFLCVKSYDTLEALTVVKPLLDADSLVVSMQNSINEEWIAPEVGAERVVGGVILVNGSFLEPGRVQASSSVSRATASADLPGVYVGEHEAPADKNARRVAGVLDHVWPSQSIDDLAHERWSKMVNNTMLNPVSAIGGMKSAELLANADARRLAVRLAAETMRVAEAEGHPLSVILGEYAAEDVYATAAGDTDAVERALADRAHRVSPSAMTSMYQDVQRKRRTEIDYFSGLVAQKGAGHGIPTPHCDIVTRLVHDVESGALTPSPSAVRQALHD